MTPALWSPSRLQGQLIADRYELVRCIGGGGMGEVWEARHVTLDAPVAIKFALEPRAAERTYWERFRREACAMARVRCPSVVQVYDAGVFEGRPYLVMELLEGETLRARLDRTPTLALSQAAQLAEQVGRALSELHRRSLIHRDITPNNVFLVTDPETPDALSAKLLDLGIAKDQIHDDQITISGAIIGSPAYMSPEQARAEVVDERSDLWSFGAVLFRAVTGACAFEAKSTTEVLFRICAGELPRATAANPALPSELDAFFERAFARNPAYRFQNAAQMAREFCAIVAPPKQTPFSIENVRQRNAVELSNGRVVTITAHDGSNAETPPRPSPWLAVAVTAVVSAALGIFGGQWLATARVAREFRDHGLAPGVSSSESANSTSERPKASVVSDAATMAAQTNGNAVGPVGTPAATSTSQQASAAMQTSNVGEPSKTRAAAATNSPNLPESSSKSNADRKPRRNTPYGTVPKAASEVDPIFGLPVHRAP